MKDIVILAAFCGPLDGSFNSRFLYLADMLAIKNKVEIITSDFEHGSKKHYYHEIEKHNYPITMLHETSYHHNICIRRFIGHCVWARNVRKYLMERNKPDVVYCAIPTLLASYMAARFCEKNRIRFVIDIQDLWPEAFQIVFNVPIIKTIGFSPFHALANLIYKRADAICAVSDTYCQRALKVNKKCNKAVTVYLGTKLSVFDEYAAQDPILKKRKGDIWLAYCGSMAVSYDVFCLIDAVKKLRIGNVYLIAMGDGPRKREYKHYAEKKGINAIFTGRIQYSKMCSLLSHCDIAVNPIAHMAAQSIINKHADYAASGLPVVSTQENEEYRNLIEEYQMGFNCKNSDPDDLSSKILRLIKDKKLRLMMGKNARRCAEERFDRAKTYHLLEKMILFAPDSNKI